MMGTVKERRLNVFVGKVLLVFAAAFVMLCINPRTAHAAKLPMGSESDGYYIDASGNMTVYSDEGLENWLGETEAGSRTYKMLVKTLTIKEGVTAIRDYGDYGFVSEMPFSEDCDNLTTISLPKSLTKIDARAFAGCAKLESVTIAEPSSLTTIGASAFNENRNLKTINIPDSVTEIGSGAFGHCLKLELDAATLPSGLTAINGSIFESCGAMTGSLTIPDGVTSIGDNAFYGTQLTSVTIPESVTSIENSAFENCEKLISVTIPDGVTSIGESAFNYCITLPSVTIPASVTSIGSKAFYRCEALISVAMLGETPPTLGSGDGSDNVFKDAALSTIDKQIYVPKSSIAAYKANWTQWKDYINDGESAGGDDPSAADPGGDDDPVEGNSVKGIDPTAEDYADTAIDVQGFTKDATIYSVDVEWGAMTFQYENTTWDATTHTTVPGAGWKVYDSVKNEALDSKTDAINRIQLTNHSNAAVKATFTYTGASGYEDTLGSFAKADGDTETNFDSSDKPTVSLDTADNSGNADIAGTPTKGTLYFMPNGIKEELKHQGGITKWQQLGTITINIVPL